MEGDWGSNTMAYQKNNILNISPRLNTVYRVVQVFAGTYSTQSKNKLCHFKVTFLSTNNFNFQNSPVAQSFNYRTKSFCCWFFFTVTATKNIFRYCFLTPRVCLCLKKQNCKQYILTVGKKTRRIHYLY